jgi:hypothetical protein
MTHDFHDFMVPTVEKFAYLKCPDKIRVAVINAGGPRLSVDAIQRRLDRLPVKVEGAHIGEPTEGDGIDFRVRGTVAPLPAPVRRGTSTISPDERKRIAELAKGIPDKPKQSVQVFRWQGPPPVYGSTSYADSVIERVCDAMDLPRETFFSSSRQKYVVAARAVVVRVLRDRNTAIYSFPRIAEIVGRNDHSTMHWAYQQFDHYCNLFPILRPLYDELRAE